MTKGDLLSRMSCDELFDWVEYFRVVNEEPQQDAAEMTPDQIAAAFGAQRP